MDASMRQFLWFVSVTAQRFKAWQIKANLLRLLFGTLAGQKAKLFSQNLKVADVTSYQHFLSDLHAGPVVFK